MARLVRQITRSLAKILILCGGLAAGYYFCFGGGYADFKKLVGPYVHPKPLARTDATAVAAKSIETPPVREEQVKPRTATVEQAMSLYKKATQWPNYSSSKELLQMLADMNAAARAFEELERAHSGVRRLNEELNLGMLAEQARLEAEKLRARLKVVLLKEEGNPAPAPALPHPHPSDSSGLEWLAEPFNRARRAVEETQTGYNSAKNADEQGDWMIKLGQAKADLAAEFRQLQHAAAAAATDLDIVRSQKQNQAELAAARTRLDSMQRILGDAKRVMEELDCNPNARRLIRKYLLKDGTCVLGGSSFTESGVIHIRTNDGRGECKWVTIRENEVVGEEDLRGR